MSRTYEDICNADGYGRISLEDRDKRNFSMESDSISSQKVYIEQFCKEHGIKLKDYLFDDGITGQTFDRAGWDELLKEIEAGRINCVITKDLSRLGRDHSETGFYIEKYFPEHRVRYISINDNWDSKYDSVDLILWKLAYNDVYCADISRKVKSILDSKKKQGLYVGSFAPYGYMKHPDDKHILIPDPDVAHVVTEIFDLAYEGKGTCAIANILNDKKYTTPGLYSGRGRETKTRKEVGAIWTSYMIRRILMNQVYCGDVVQSKIKKASYKSKKCIHNAKEDWVIVENKHEPLTERFKYEAIQKKLVETSKKYNRLPGEQHLLSKLLYCKDCGHRISIGWRNKNNHDAGRIGYCNYYKKYSKHGVCSPHFVDYEVLENQLIDYLKDLCTKYLKYLDTPKLIRESYKNIREKITQNEAIYSKLLKEKEKNENIAIKLYEDKLNEVITETMYKMMALKKENEIEAINTQILDIENDIEKLKKQLEKDNDKINDTKTILNNFLNSKIITEDLLNQIITKIEVSENNDIEVSFAIEELKEIKS